MRPIFSRVFVFVAIIILLLIGIFVFVGTRRVPELTTPVATPTASVQWPMEKVIGKSVLGRPIESYTYGQGKNHVVFVGGIHGGYEWNGVLLAYQLIDYLTENQAEISMNLTVTVIPSLNPDGVYKVVGKEGRFAMGDVTVNKKILAEGRFNANEVDLNRNFDCDWNPEAKWQSKTVSAGTASFSEPEAVAIKNFVSLNNPSAFVFWHSQANAVYGSECGGNTLPETTTILNLYGKASGYPIAKTFDSYVVHGDVTDWLASVHIPAISVELKTHETIEWEKNLAGIKALLEYYGLKK